MASLSVLTFNNEGHPIQFDTWLNDLQLYLLSDSRDNVSLFDHTSGASLAPPATADSATRSQWLTRDAAARLAVRNHPPLAERTHFGQDKTAKALYDAVVARYSSPATAALGRLIVPYLFPELSAFATVEDLVAPLRTSDARYRAALPAEFLDKNPPPIVVSLGVARRTHRTPFFEGCSPSPLGPSYTSAAAVDIHGAEDVGAVSALSGKHRSSKGKGGKVGGGGSGGGGGGGSGGGGGGGGGDSSGSGGGSGGFSGGGGGSGGSGSRGSGGIGGGRTGIQCGGSGGGQRQQQQQRRSKIPSPQQLREWFAQRGAFGGSAELLRSGVDIFALEFDAILAAMYALSVSAEGVCYQCVPPDPGIEAAALGASESDLRGTAPAEALHTFTLDSGASCYFFRDSTTLTPLSALVPIRLAYPSGGPVLARSSTVLSCLAVPSGSLSGCHPPSFSTNLVSTAALQDAMVTTTTPGGVCVKSRRSPLLVSPPDAPESPEAPPTWSPLPATPSGYALPPPCSWSSHVFASPPALACPALPSLSRGAAARRSSLLLVSPDDCSPANSPHGRVGPNPLRLQLRERFREDLPVLRLHSDRGGEFSSNLLREFYRGEGILQSFTLPASPQQNGVAERCIGFVMEVARSGTLRISSTSGPVSPCRRPRPYCVGRDRLAMRRCSGSGALVPLSVILPRTSSLSSAIPCVFLGFPCDAPGWQFYHPTSRRVFLSHDVTFDKSVHFYHLFPYRTAPLCESTTAYASYACLPSLYYAISSIG
ncbi:unnamed protein product [Closterium sp. NIES-53]